MKTSAVLSLALVGAASAYPSIVAHLAQEKAAKREFPSLTKRVPFDAKSQLVDVTGAHAFKAPGKNDQRGPCPGLNALANHGYLPHNGIGTIQQFIDSTTKVFGMGVDLATFLAIYGSVFDGDLTEWSIGGPSSLVSLPALLGQPTGISGSHNKYEGDASPTRGDLYQYGNDYLLQMSQFKGLYDLGKADDNYDLDLLTSYRYTRFQESINNNPYFFNAPFSGVIAQPAAWAFIYRFMANKSAEYPEGRLTGDVLKSFYAISGDSENSFVYKPGYERIPNNWYTRNVADAYTIPYLSLDSTAMLLAHPEFGSVGGNTGKTNSFVGLDPANLTSGVYSASNLGQNNNLICYGLELTIQETPDLLSNLYTSITNALSKISGQYSSAVSSLGCPKLTKINEKQFAKYPGYSKAYKGYTPVLGNKIL